MYNISTRRVLLFIYINKYGLIRWKNTRSEIVTIIQKNQCISFIPEYKLINVEHNKYKVNILVENELLRRDISFIRIGNKNHSSYVKAS